MKAIQYQAYGDYSTNQFIEMDPPHFDGEGVLVRMEFAGVNPLDNTFRSGHFPASTPQNLPRIGGQTGVGVVARSSYPTFPVGTRVFVMGLGMGVIADGTWREFLVAAESSLIPIPDHVSSESAAAFLAGGGYVTGYLALMELARLRPGQSVLAPGVGGAVGMETVQIAEQLGVSIAISTASTKEKAELARSEGYQNVIDLSSQNLTEEMYRLTDGKGVDVIVDGVAGDLYPQLLKGLAFGGSYIVVGYSGGRDVQQAVTDVIWKAASIRGFNPRAISASAFKSAMSACIELLAAGKLRPTVSSIFPLEEAADAVRFLIEERPFGRVLLSISGQ
ncbi:zinc-binding alcohol dehydrogenase family protein [Granulicella cerasi]|uniref:Zinc-binding alcohol dehydrogenase family protein n=1 Tax=Granulicella cerasi TaxID=741063 RepID=A0ABW1ZC59_9BACT|nr:zinc-binding dehydrogenase [Granulicella cerasi]